MSKKKINIDAMRQGMRKTKSVEEIEEAVSKIHKSEAPVSKPKSKKTKPVPKPKIQIPKPVRFSFNMSKSLHLDFKIHCMKKDSTMSDEILMMIQKTISKNSKM